MLNLIILSLIAIGIAMVVGWQFSLSWTDRPTLGDVIKGTFRYPAYPAIVFIIVIWWGLY